MNAGNSKMDMEGVDAELERVYGWWEHGELSDDCIRQHWDENLPATFYAEFVCRHDPEKGPTKARTRGAGVRLVDESENTQT